MLWILVSSKLSPHNRFHAYAPATFIVTSPPPVMFAPLFPAPPIKHPIVKSLCSYLLQFAPFIISYFMPSFNSVISSHFVALSFSGRRWLVLDDWRWRLEALHGDWRRRRWMGGAEGGGRPAYQGQAPLSSPVLSQSSRFVAAAWHVRAPPCTPPISLLLLPRLFSPRATVILLLLLFAQLFLIQVDVRWNSAPAAVPRESLATRPSLRLSISRPSSQRTATAHQAEEVQATS
jgi:hypothetical protein